MLKALLVSVGCLVSKGMLDLVVSTVVMVVTEPKARLVLKALLVRRVPRVKVLLAHAENVVKMVMTALQAATGAPLRLLVVKGGADHVRGRGLPGGFNCGRGVMVTTEMLDLGVGVHGRDGRDGAKGATGAQGIAGERGLPGVKGDAGPSWCQRS